jgi:hypothetical protein
VKPFDGATALFRTRFLQTISVVAELVLVDAGCATDGDGTGILLVK